MATNLYNYELHFVNELKKELIDRVRGGVTINIDHDHDDLFVNLNFKETDYKHVFHHLTDRIHMGCSAKDFADEFVVYYRDFLYGNVRKKYFKKKPMEMDELFGLNREEVESALNDLKNGTGGSSTHLASIKALEAILRIMDWVDDVSKKGGA